MGIARTNISSKFCDISLGFESTRHTHGWSADT